jgi:glycerol-3-phosphate dehydrogenase
MGPTYDVAIVGAGVVGLNVAYKLDGHGLKLLVVEKTGEAGTGVTGGQAEVIHVVQLPFSSLKSRLARLGNKEYDGMCKELGVSLLRVPALLVARGSLMLLVLPFVYLYLRWELGNDFHLELRRRSKLQEIEPELSDSVTGGIVVHGYGVVDSKQLVKKLVEHLQSEGVEFRFNTEVLGGKSDNDRVVLETSAGKVACRYVVNAAGLYSDEMARNLGTDLGEHIPGLGVMAEFADLPVKSILAPLLISPGARTKGGAIIPTTRGTTVIGPTLREIKAKEGWSADENDLHVLLEKFGPLLKSQGNLIRLFAGVRPMSPTRDFVIDFSESKRVINLVGIESPGLTSAPAIAKIVAEKLGVTGG